MTALSAAVALVGAALLGGALGLYLPLALHELGIALPEAAAYDPVLPFKTSAAGATAGTIVATASTYRRRRRSATTPAAFLNT